MGQIAQILFFRSKMVKMGNFVRHYDVTRQNDVIMEFKIASFVSKDIVSWV